MTPPVALTIPIRKLIVPFVLVVAGVTAAGYGVVNSPDRTWPNLLLNGFYMMSLAVSGAFFLATQRATGARWSAALRRIPEAFMMALPVTAAFMLFLFLERHHLFSWTRPETFASVPAFAGKLQYLKTSWVFERVLGVLAVWTAFVFLLRRTSLAQDRHPELALKLHERLTQYGVLFIPAFALTFTLAAYDWMVSLDPSWFSTMFAIYVFIGVFVQGIAAVTLATIVLKVQGPLEDTVTERHLHDLGKMVLAFTTFWAYIWVCQYLLIWYGNIPEEVTHYASRTNGPWLYLFAVNFVINWVIPFVVLLPQSRKRNPAVLGSICALLLVGHWLDVDLLVLPTFTPAGPRFGMLELALAGGAFGLTYLLFVYSLSRAPLTPLNDPILAYESLDHGGEPLYASLGVKQ